MRFSIMVIKFLIILYYLTGLTLANDNSTLEALVVKQKSISIYDTIQEKQYYNVNSYYSSEFMIKDSLHKSRKVYSFLYSNKTNIKYTFYHPKNIFSLLQKSNEDPSKTIDKIEVNEFPEKVKIKDWICKKYKIVYYFKKYNQHSKWTDERYVALNLDLPKTLINSQMFDHHYNTDNPDYLKKLSKTVGLEIYKESKLYNHKGDIVTSMITETEKIYKTKVKKIIFQIPEGYKQTIETVFN